jgi:hypothetical protein
MRRDTLRLHERHAARRRRHNAGAHQHGGGTRGSRSTTMTMTSEAIP